MKEDGKVVGVGKQRDMEYIIEEMVDVVEMTT